MPRPRVDPQVRAATRARLRVRTQKRYRRPFVDAIRVWTRRGGPCVAAFFWIAEGKGWQPAASTLQVASLLGVSVAQVRWLIHEGALEVLGHFGPLALVPLVQVLTVHEARVERGQEAAEIPALKRNRRIGRKEG